MRSTEDIKLSKVGKGRAKWELSVGMAWRTEAAIISQRTTEGARGQRKASWPQPAPRKGWKSEDSKADQQSAGQRQALRDTQGRWRGQEGYGRTGRSRQGALEEPSELPLSGDGRAHTQQDEHSPGVPPHPA